jgi:hypothetical protein
LLLFFAALGLFYTYPQTQTFFIKQPPAANFYSLPMIAEFSNTHFPQSIFSNFYHDFFLIPQKKSRVKVDAIPIELRGSGKPTKQISIATYVHS